MGSWSIPSPLRALRPAPRGRYSPMPRTSYRLSSNAYEEEAEKGLNSPSSPSGDSDFISSGPSSLADSSRNTSNSYTPMLSQRPPMRLSRPRWLKFPARPVRFLSTFLILTVVVFVLMLFRMSVVSSKQLELGNMTKRPPPPAPWEEFNFLKRYFGGVRTLVSREANQPEYPRSSEDPPLPKTESAINKTIPESRAFNPYPQYSSQDYIAKYGEVMDCMKHPNATRIPQVQVYSGVPLGEPENVMGSYELLGLRKDVCFERFGRLGPYGYGYSVKSGGIGAGLHGDREGAQRVWKDEGEIDYRRIRWGELQDQCSKLNRHRFNDVKVDSTPSSFLKAPEDNLASESVKRQENQESASSKPQSAGKEKLPRTAFVIRTWSNFKYREEDILYLRALVTELSLKSGGEYTIHFLVHVKDNDLQIWADPATHQKTLNDSLPEEFRGMATLWSERQMGLIYGGFEESFFRGLPVHGAYRSTFLPMQWFAQQHQEYEFFWQWEMDIRYTGHYYHLFDKVTSWAKKQPRKGIWERNSRFYVPDVDGSWEDFMQMVRVQTEKGTDDPNNMWSSLDAGDKESHKKPKGKGDKPIWGPERPPHEKDILKLDDEPQPPTSYEKDKYDWGVGEDADLITFNPMFDPEGTTWLLAEDITGYNTTEKFPPRRAATITASRLSRKLLNAMHRESFQMRHTMFSEAWPASCALHHGYKAVYAPHPVYVDREWPTSYLASVFNGGRNGATGGARTSIFGEREHNFRGTTWYYNAGFSPNLWRRWLGFKVDNDGGEEHELAGEGRMCLPAVLLHPVKNIDLVIEAAGSPDEKEKKLQEEKEKEKKPAR